MHRKIINVFKSAVGSVDPGKLIKSGIVVDNFNRKLEIFGNVLSINTNFHVVGFGKAVASMASALQCSLQHRIKSGVLSVPHLLECDIQPPIIVRHGAENNLPDSNSIQTTNEILSLCSKVPSDHVILVLISGGGSSLFCKPVDWITLEDKLLTIKLLNKCGASIQELNTVRKKISAVKGGGFGCRLRNNNIRTVCLILSDVIGDPLDIIASGPTVVNADSNDNAMDVIQKYQLDAEIPAAVLKVLVHSETVNPKEFKNIENIVIGSNVIALQSAKLKEESENCKIVIGSSTVSGLVPLVAEWYLKVSMEMLKFLTSNCTVVPDTFKKLLVEQDCTVDCFVELERTKEIPGVQTVCLLMGGETTVEVKGNGKGGRNQELSLRFGSLLHSAKSKSPELFQNWDVSLLSAGTDGIDGPTNVAGAVGCAELIEVGLRNGLDVNKYLENNDSYAYISLIDNGRFFIKTGHTNTNVMDIHILGLQKISNSPYCKL